MLPHAHLALGYLTVSAYTNGALRRAPGQRELGAILIGSQFADLIDKPLVLLGEPFVSGRTVAHSMLVVLPAFLCLLFASRSDAGTQSTVVAFGLSWAVQPFADASLFVLQGTVARDLIETSFLVWPVILPADGIINAISNSAYVEQVIRKKPTWTARTLPKSEDLRFWIRISELSVAVVAGIKWYRDGVPGLERIRSILESV